MKESTLVVAVLVFLTLTASCAQPVRMTPDVSLTTASPTPDAQSTNMSPPTRVSSENTDAAEPAIATSTSTTSTTGRDDSVYLAWVEHRPKREADVWLAHLDRDGNALGLPARVNPVAGQATAWHGDPPTVCVAPDGTVYVGWTARATSHGGDTTFYLSASHDHGKTFGAPFKINDDRQPAAHGMHSLAVAPDGRIYAAWLDERNVVPPPPSQRKVGDKHVESNSEVFFSYSTDGGRSFSPNQRIAVDVCPCCKTSLTTGSDGRVYLGWRQVLPGEFRHIAVASSTDGGQSFSAPVIVSDDRWMIAGCPVSGPALAAGTDGALRVLWYAAGEAVPPGLYWSESRDGGRTFSPRTPLAQASGRGAPVLLENPDRNFTAVWEDTGNASTHITTAQLTGDRNTNTIPTINALPGTGELPAATAAGGRLLIAYISKHDAGRAVFLTRAKLPGAAQE